MKLKISYLILFTLILNIFSANATIRFVSKTGTSTPPYTSWETASDSIQKCINICVDGDTVYVANGVYKENLVINTQIFLSGLSMDSTVIDGRGMGNRTIRFNAVGSLVNFNIYGIGLNTLQTDVITAFKYIEIKYCRISEAAVGIGLINSASVNNTFITNCLYGSVGGPVSDTCKIYFNDNLLTFDNSNATGIGSSIYGIYHITNNLILFTSTNSAESGISIGAPRKVYINNNLISGFANNIFIDTIQDSAIIQNNILINQTGGGVSASLLSLNYEVNAKNLILEKNRTGIRGFPIKSNYNLFWQNMVDIIGIPGDSDRVADPMFVNDTIPTADSNYNFHLQAFSPGIDRGDPNILDLDGTRSDIGLYGGPFGETYTYQDLAPLAPRNLSAEVDTNKILLKWNRNTEADTSYYKVYRDTVNSFQIDSTKLIASPTDTSFIQLPPYYGSKYAFKITCVDNQGNESKPSEEVVVDLTSVSTDDYPMIINDYLLYQNYPNPFNPSTKIGYKLKERSYVKLMVYDIKGELIIVLVNKEQSAGYYEVEFTTNNQLPTTNNLASGIYLYRIEVIDDGNIPIYTETKKMLMIK